LLRERARARESERASERECESESEREKRSHRAGGWKRKRASACATAWVNFAASRPQAAPERGWASRSVGDLYGCSQAHGLWGWRGAWTLAHARAGTCKQHRRSPAPVPGAHRAPASAAAFVLLALQSLLQLQHVSLVCAVENKKNETRLSRHGTVTVRRY
jgi:hypothetical protein